MLNFVDNFLNKTTMYKVVLYVLIFFFGASLFLSFFGFLSYTPMHLISSLLIILSISWITNIIFSFFYNAPTNTESIYITALILFFLITPVEGGAYSQFLPFAFWASVWAMASKYILAIKGKHIFNPAAFAVVLTAMTLNQSASWWIGTPNMLPFVLIGGFLIIRKIRRADLFFAFMISAFVTISALAIFKGSNVVNTLMKTLTDSAFFFFAFVMLTEPLTAPTTKWLRIAFGAIVGFLFAPALHFGIFYSTPELALIIGNIFAYIVSPKEKLFLKLKNRIKVGIDTFDFIFEKDKNFNFRPGQYMEWTLKHRSPDTRGNRRYFTLASSPTEEEIHLGVKFYPEPSSFKNRLLALPPGGEIIAAQKSGDFVLPEDLERELVFIAGGIGITPFRSMIKYLLDKKQKRFITLLYSNKTTKDIAYKEIFDEARAELGIKTLYVVTGKDEIVTGNFVQRGAIDARMIEREVPDYKNKTFYISGPRGMVDAFENTLKSIGVSRKNIKTDFFPGFA
jgi:ferredoxin-NADP reductase